MNAANLDNRMVVNAADDSHRNIIQKVRPSTQVTARLLNRLGI